ncbi:alcohol dehydrogenase catalytic domain-containing protein [Streptomyces sp. ODS28]|uniref:zinc-dependent alcohol dehydrogenase n=1 Tax=Streptomyces sp. ODS28 TaxID=3136688 RepID=UPI0031F006C1
MSGPHDAAAPSPRTQRSVLVEGPRAHRITHHEAPEPGPGEVRVAVHAAGVCASDREVYEGTRAPGYVRYPVVPGHEWSGTVDTVGDGVDPKLTGRKVVAEGFRACLRCDRCREGSTSLCASGYEETGFTCPGAFAETLNVPARLLHPLPDEADLRAAALLEPSAVSAAAVLAGAPLPGERVAVVGAGTLGLLAAQLLAAYSPGELLVIDPRTRRAELALELGATHAAAPDEEAAPGHGEAPDARYDLVIETAGAPTTAEAACALARRGGRVVLTGMYEPGVRGIDPLRLVTGQLTVRGVFGASSAAWAHAVRAFSAGLLTPSALITHELPLEEFGAAMDLLSGGDDRVGKVLLRP